MKKLFILLIFFLNIQFAFTQIVYQHISNSNIYEFLEEMANMQIITINSAIKPYSRKLIASKLKKIQEKEGLLNNRQKKELNFYLKNFIKEIDDKKVTDYYFKKVFDKNKKDNSDKRLDLFYYKDSLFTFSVNPILGINYFINDKKTIYHRWNGAEAFAYIGKHWGFYANLRDNHEQEMLETTDFFTQKTGAVYKGDGKGGGDYSEMRGGITYSWKWGSIGLVKDHFAWGDNYNGSNIFSGRTPSFAHIKLNINPVKWFDFNYVHGWLVSEVVDSNRTYNYGNGIRTVFHNKYIAANMFTFIPFKKFNISVGNSIVYSDIGVHPAYLIPFLFYKSVDHTLNSTDNRTGQNAQMFLNISSRQIKHLHLYTSFFVDEISIGRMWDSDKQSNFVSGKFGFCLSNIIQNVSFISEYTRTNPLTYQHLISTTTFETNNFNLGHYLRDNSQEIYFCIKLKPAKALHIDLSYIHAQHGNDYDYENMNGLSTLGLPFMENTIWDNETYSVKINYKVINDGFIFLEYISNNIADKGTIKHSPEFFRGCHNIISCGANLGF